MPGLGTNFDRNHVIREDKAFIPFTVEDKIKFMLRMGICDPSQGLIGHPSNPFQLIGK